jgi:hypothetical protein
MLALRFGLAVLASSAIALACSGSDTTAPLSAEDACKSLAHALCAKLGECSKIAVTLEYGDVATCETRAKINCLPSLNAPGTGTTTNQVASCADAGSAFTCADLLGHKLPDACQVVAGNLADGAACSDDAQCKNKLCRKKATATCGACSSPSAGGASCERTADCASGLACANAVCVPYGAAGGTCDDAHPCNPTLTCRGGTCAEALALGATCTATGDCGLLQGAVCHPTKKVCVTVDTAAAGAACNAVGEGFAICAAKGTCKNNVCLGAAADGQPCDDTNGPKCVSPAICDSGACKIPDPAACK